MSNNNDIAMEIKACFRAIRDAARRGLSDPQFVDSTLKYIEAQIQRGESLINQQQMIKHKSEIELRCLTYSELSDLAARLMTERNNLSLRSFKNSNQWLDVSEALTAPSIRKSVDTLRNLRGNMFAFEMAGRLAELSRKRAEPAIEAKLAKDPRQAEKMLIKECWREWRKSPVRYRGKAAFARDMISKCEHLESTKVIEDWCREWEKSEPC